jgi:hypothetical protein
VLKTRNLLIANVHSQNPAYRLIRYFLNVFAVFPTHNNQKAVNRAQMLDKSNVGIGG